MVSFEREKAQTIVCGASFNTKQYVEPYDLCCGGNAGLQAGSLALHVLHVSSEDFPESIVAGLPTTKRAISTTSKTSIPSSTFTSPSAM